MTNNNIPFHIKLTGFCSGLYKTLRFFYHYVQRRRKFGRFEYPYHQVSDNSLIRVLGTGPSLKREVEELCNSGAIFKDPLFVMNFFAFSDLFYLLKPTRYCLADPGFYKEKIRVDKVNELFKVLNEKVIWKMKLYVPNTSEKVARSKIYNRNINIIPISTLHFEGFESKRNLFYKRGYATPSFVNVLMMIEYVCINEGFKKILLYGADHSFLKDLIVGDDNILYVQDAHFYGTERTIADVHTDGTPWRVAEFIYNKYLTFIEHDVLRRYADYIGAEIINCTKDSWIDSYVRLAQIEKDINNKRSGDTKNTK